MKQYGSGKCSICNSPGTTKKTCPCNPHVTRPDFKKHPNWINICRDNDKNISQLPSVKIPSSVRNSLDIEYDDIENPKNWKLIGTYNNPKMVWIGKGLPPSLRSKITPTINEKPVWQSYDCSTTNNERIMYDDNEPDFNSCKPIWWPETDIIKTKQAKYYASLNDNTISKISKQSEDDICISTKKYEPSTSWKKQQNIYYNNLTDIEKELLYDYSYHGDTILNTYLRGNIDDAINNYNGYIHDNNPIFIKITEQLLSFNDLGNECKILLKTYANDNNITIEKTFSKFLHQQKEGDAMSNSMINIKRSLPVYWKKKSIIQLIETVSGIINNIIANSPPLDNDIIVYRGISNFDYFSLCNNNNKIMRGFLSCTFDFGVALTFGKIQDLDKITKKTIYKKKESSVMKIHIPAGTKCIYFMIAGKYGEESELLFSDRYNICINQCNIYDDIPDVTWTAECWSNDLLKVKICDVILSYP